MTNEELDRLTRLRPRNPGDRAELDAAVVNLRAQGGREAQIAEALCEALRKFDEENRKMQREFDDEITDATMRYLRNTQNLQFDAQLNEAPPRG